MYGYKAEGASEGRSLRSDSGQAEGACAQDTNLPHRENPYIAKPVHQKELFEVLGNPSIIQVHDPAISFDGALFDGDLEFLAEIVNLFLETYPGLLCEIENAVSRKDADALRRFAHTLKGAVANFGALAVVEQAKALEMMGKDGDLSSAGEAAEALRALIERFVPELHAALGRAAEKQVFT